MNVSRLPANVILVIVLVGFRLIKADPSRNRLLWSYTNYSWLTLSVQGVAVSARTLFKRSMLALPSVSSHCLPAASPSAANGLTPGFQVARPQSTPLKVEPASLANLSSSRNNSLETPADRKMNGKSVASDWAL